jgi:hypothetical protein
MVALQCALDGLRQGELWLCHRHRTFAEAAEEDLTARAKILQELWARVDVLEETVEKQSSAIHQLVDRDTQLLELRRLFLESQQRHNMLIAELGGQVTSLARRFGDHEKNSRRRMDELLNDVLAMRADIERRHLDVGVLPFREHLCDELLRLATVLRTGDRGGGPLPSQPASDLERRIAAAQDVARVLRSPVRSVASPAPSISSSRHVYLD